jgi:hypothetical protein
MVHVLTMRSVVAANTIRAVTMEESQDSKVGKATILWAGLPGNQCSISGRGRVK